MEFRDGCDNVLRVDATMGTLRRIRQRTNCYLIDAIILNEDGNSSLLMKLEGDDIFLAEVLYAACSDQINATFDEWIERQTAEHMRAGHAALMQALPLFFKRPELRRFMEIVMQAWTDSLIAARQSLSDEMDRKQELSGTSTPTTAPESPDSTPTPEPSES